jgi:hypothetical protein
VKLHKFFSLTKRFGFVFLTVRIFFKVYPLFPLPNYAKRLLFLIVLGTIIQEEKGE